MSWKKTLLKNSRLCLILDQETCGTSRNMRRILREALKGGVDIVQYRDKISSSKMMTEQAKTFHKITRKFHVPLIINDRLDVFLETEAEGIHLGQGDLPLETVRRVLGSGKIIGFSCHSASDVVKSRGKNADYLGFGPVFKTKTKPLSMPRGPGAVKKVLKISHLPVFAIGGITQNNIDRIPGAGKKRTAVCRALCLAKDIKKSARELKRKLEHV